MKDYIFTAQEINKLPKWAQEKLHILNNQVRTMRGAMQEMTEETPSNVYWNDYSTDARKFIPDNAIVRFQLPDGYITMHMYDDRVQVLGSTRIKLNPHASNHIEIRIDDD